MLKRAHKSKLIMHTEDISLFNRILVRKNGYCIVLHSNNSFLDDFTYVQQFGTNILNLDNFFTLYHKSYSVSNIYSGEEFLNVRKWKFLHLIYASVNGYDCTINNYGPKSINKVDNGLVEIVFAELYKYYSRFKNNNCQIMVSIILETVNEIYDLYEDRRKKLNCVNEKKLYRIIDVEMIKSTLCNHYSIIPPDSKLTITFYIKYNIDSNEISGSISIVDTLFGTSNNHACFTENIFHLNTEFGDNLNTSAMIEFMEANKYISENPILLKPIPNDLIAIKNLLDVEMKRRNSLDIIEEIMKTKESIDKLNILNTKYNLDLLKTKHENRQISKRLRDLYRLIEEYKTETSLLKRDHRYYEEGIEKFNKNNIVLSRKIKTNQSEIVEIEQSLTAIEKESLKIGRKKGSPKRKSFSYEVDFSSSLYPKLPKDAPKLPKYLPKKLKAYADQLIKCKGLSNSPVKYNIKNKSF